MAVGTMPGGFVNHNGQSKSELDVSDRAGTRIHGRCTWQCRAGEFLGGTSSINGMLYVRGQKQDFDEWQAGNPGWSYDAVRPYFIKSENSQELLQAAAENGQKIDAKYQPAGAFISIEGPAGAKYSG